MSSANNAHREMSQMVNRLMGMDDVVSISKAEMRQLMKEVYNVGWHAGVGSGITDDKPSFETEKKLKSWREFLDMK